MIEKLDKKTLKNLGWKDLQSKMLTEIWDKTNEIIDQLNIRETLGHFPPLQTLSIEPIVVAPAPRGGKE